MKKLVGALVVVALIGVIAVPRVIDSINSEQETDQSENDKVTVGGLQIMQGDLSSEVTLIATTQANESMNVLPKISAEVEEMKVVAGQYVNEGDVLFTLDKESVEDQVKQTEIALTLAQVGVKNARSNASQAQVGYELAQTNYTIQYDNYEYAQDNLQKNEALFEEGIISESQYEQLKIQSSPDQIDVLDKQLEQAQGTISAANIGIESAQAQLLQAQEAYDNAVELLEDMTVTAPLSGYVALNNISEGAIAANTQVAMRIDEIKDIIVKSNVTESLVSDLKIGDKVKVTIGALDDRVYEGTIEEVSTASNQATLLYPIKVKINNRDEAIKPGMFASVIIQTAYAKNTLYVPSEVILLRDGVRYVYILQGEDQVSRVKVEVGIDNGYFTQITEGVTAEDIVVSEGMGLIDESSTIKLIRSDQE